MLRTEKLEKRIAELEHQRDALLKALRQIESRIQGIWDDPDLVAFGPISTITTWDCLQIIAAAFNAAERKET